MPEYSVEDSKEFLSTLSLRRATRKFWQDDLLHSNFYPRSPCGERQIQPVQFVIELGISIHALLAESDNRRRHSSPQPPISIHALLAESDGADRVQGLLEVRISIHALLAESDLLWCGITTPTAHFYPRSPCGERLALAPARYAGTLFLSTLSLRRATGCRRRFWRRYTHFYPRSPCGERLLGQKNNIKVEVFLSTLSLRRATHAVVAVQLFRRISIHALLAESDFLAYFAQNMRIRFLSTLSLRRATRTNPRCPANCSHFYPRSPCGERLPIFNSSAARVLFLSTLSLRRATEPVRLWKRGYKISIHALLAESDHGSLAKHPADCGFLSTLSLRRATGIAPDGYRYCWEFLSTLSLRRATA